MANWRMRRQLACLLVLIVFTLGCTATEQTQTQTNPVISYGPGAFSVPTSQLASVTAGGSLDGSVAGWGPDGHLLILTFGSSSCPRLPPVVQLVDSHTLTITTAPLLPEGSTAAAMCTADSSPTTSAVAIPAGLDPQTEVTVIFDGIAQKLLPRG